MQSWVNSVMLEEAIRLTISLHASTERFQFLARPRQPVMRIIHIMAQFVEKSVVDGEFIVDVN